MEIDQSKFNILADKEWGGTRVLFLGAVKNKY